MKNIVKVAGTVVVVGAIGYVVVKKVKERKQNKALEEQVQEQAERFAEEILNDLNETNQENK